MYGNRFLIVNTNKKIPKLNAKSIGKQVSPSIELKVFVYEYSYYFNFFFLVGNRVIPQVYLPTNLVSEKFSEKGTSDVTNES